MEIDPLDTSHGNLLFPAEAEASPSSSSSQPPTTTTTAATANGGAIGKPQPQAPLARARSRSSVPSVWQQQTRLQEQKELAAGSPGTISLDDPNSPLLAQDATAASSSSQQPLPQPRRTSYGNLNTPPSPKGTFRPDFGIPPASPTRAGKITVSGFAPLGNPLGPSSSARPTSSPSFRPSFDPGRRSSLAHSLRLHNVPGTSPTEADMQPAISSSASLPAQFLPPATPATLNDIAREHYERNHRSGSTSNSAPPSPSALSILHPPAFIHTHHPRRGSLVPLNLNLISPAPPSPEVQEAVRRESSVFSAFTPIAGGTPVSPAAARWTPRESIGGFVRRRSLTPSVATLAPASPTKLLASGSIARGSVSGQGEAAAGPSNRNLSPTRQRGKQRPSVSAEGQALPFGTARMLGPVSASHLDYTGRRASQPTLSRDPLGPGEIRRRPSSDKDMIYTSHHPLAQHRPNSQHEIGISHDFTFGAVHDPTRLSPTSSARNSPTASTSGLSTAESEAAEAERQRIAFMKAAYGQAPRVSVSGVLARRPSHLREELGVDDLAGNEGFRRGSLGLSGYTGLGLSGSGQIVGLHEGVNGGADGRRGSLPISIPLDKRATDTHSLASSSIAEDDQDSDDDGPERNMESLSPGAQETIHERSPSRRRSTLQRPLPPLLPLSDPGRDMLASTLALHRASHMLDAKNLKSDPLPHPLPPSLHPPAPVDVSDFDIDFIMQGAVDPYGISSGEISPLGGGSVPKERMPAPLPQKLRLGKGGDDEDTFAKFVGAFDEEYDDRRGEWTFKSAGTTPALRGSPVPKSGSTASSPSDRGGVSLVWESTGAGKYSITSRAEVVSHTSGKAWRVRRLAAREYDIDEVTSVWSGAGTFRPATFQPMMALTPPADGLVLAAKCVHIDVGGLKIMSSSRKASKVIQRGRIESEDSGMTAKISSLPSSSFFGTAKIFKPEFAHQVEAGGPSSGPSHGGVAMTTSTSATHPSLTPRDFGTDSSNTPGKRGRGEKVSFLETRRKSKSHDASASPTRESGPREIGSSKEDKKKEKASIGDKIKRSWLGGLNKHSYTEEKRERRQQEKEKMQSQSWSGGSSGSSVWSQASSMLGHSASASNASKGSLNNNVSPETAYQPPWLLLADSPVPNGQARAEAVDRGRVQSESAAESSARPTMGLGIEDETNSGLGWKEGRAWKNVPDEAIAMVIPLSTSSALSGSTSRPVGSPDLSTIGERTPGEPSERPRTADSLGLGSTRALLIYYVPFGSNGPEETLKGRPHKDSGKTATSAASNELALLSARFKAQELAYGKQCVLHPLPFKSFRIVGSIVSPSELRSEPELPLWPEWESPEAGSSSGTGASTSSPDMSPAPSEKVLDAKSAASPSLAAGAPSPTVIAVCHSRGQGVEFVLEGLDRLGLCQGKSAWGPQGYEEWRGSGLSDEGRQVLDIIWTGCVAVLGLQPGGMSLM